jgi:hypothetical protein
MARTNRAHDYMHEFSVDRCHAMCDVQNHDIPVGHLVKDQTALDISRRSRYLQNIQFLLWDSAVNATFMQCMEVPT